MYEQRITNRECTQYNREYTWYKQSVYGIYCIPKPITCILIQLISGFSDVILSPLYDVCGDVLELATKMIAQDDSDGECVKCDLRVWNEYLNNNKKMWKLKCKSRGKKI